MNFSLAISVAETLAPILAALGVLYAARQAVSAINQLTHAKDSQAIAVHCAFQREFREWQSRLPSEANSSTWEPQTLEHHRLIQLYWEFVFDEWYSCQVISEESRVRALWDGYAQAVEGAMHRTAFVKSLQVIFEGQTYFLGQSTAYQRELARIYLLAHPEHTMESVPFLRRGYVEPPTVFPSNRRLWSVLRYNPVTKVLNRS